MIESVSSELTKFMYNWKARGVPKEITHEAKRLFLNQLKASVGATKTDAIKILNEQTKENENLEKSAKIIWLGRQTDLESAAIVNGALFEVLDFHDTYIPCYMHATSAVLNHLKFSQRPPGRNLLNDELIASAIFPESSCYNLSNCASNWTPRFMTE